MAIAPQGTPTMGEAGSGALSADIAYPAGIVQNELLTLTVTASANGINATPPEGWLLAKDHQNTTANTASGAIFYKVATGTESGTLTVSPYVGTANASTGGRITLQMQRWSGVNTTTPLDVTGVVGGSGNATSYTHPSITTANANSVVVYSISLNASNGTNRISTSEAGLTKIGNGPTANVGREQQVYYETRATAGAAGSKVFTAGSASQWGGVSIALREGGGGGGPATPTLVQRVVGIPTAPSTNGVVQVKTTNAASVRLKCSTDSAGTTGVVYGPAVTPSANGDARLTVSGLTPNTRYYYRVAMTPTGGTESLDTNATVGRLKTAPVGQASFAFDFGSCTNATDSASMATIAARGDDLFFHLGDLFYADGSGTGLQNFRDKMNAKITATNHATLFSTTNMSYTPSDHDGMNNNGAAGSDPTAWANWNTVRDELFPMSSSYYAFTWGRVRFIQIDTRSFKSNPTATDNSSKTALGATQKQWLKDEISNMTEAVAVIIQDGPWIGATEAGDDSWWGFNTERVELGNFFAASGKNICMLAGDMHAVGADSGVNAVGGIAVFHAAPLNNSASQKGGPYSAGIYPASGTSTVQQYGRIVVTDSGSTISFDFTGYSSTNTSRITLTKTYTAPVNSTTGQLPVTVGLVGSAMPVRSSTGQLPAAVGLTATASTIARTTGQLPVTVGMSGTASLPPVRVTTGQLPATLGLTAVPATVAKTSGQVPVAVGPTADPVTVAKSTGQLPVNVFPTGNALSISRTTGSLPVDVGLSTVQQAVAGALPVSVGLVGTAVTVRSTTGVLPVSVGMSGAPSTVGRSTGQLPVAVSPAATALAISRTQGALPVEASLAGVPMVAGVITGQLPAGVGLTAAAVTVNATTGVLPVAVAPTGSASTVGRTNGQLGAAVGLTAAAGTVKATTGSLPVTAALSAAPVTVASSTGQLPVTAGLAGVPVTVKATAGQIPVAVGAAAAARTVASTTGMVPVDAGLEGFASYTEPGISSGHLRTRVELVALTTSIVADTDGQLPVTAGLTATATTVARTTGVLPVRVQPEASGYAVYRTTGQLPISVGMGSTVRTAAVTSGSLNILGQLAGTASTILDTTGSLSITASLSGSATSQVPLEASGALPVVLGLQATAVTVARTFGTVPLVALLTALAVSVQRTAGTLPLAARLDGSPSTDAVLPVGVGMVSAESLIAAVRGELPVLVGASVAARSVGASTGTLPLAVVLQGVATSYELGPRDIRGIRVGPGFMGGPRFGPPKT